MGQTILIWQPLLSDPSQTKILLYFKKKGKGKYLQQAISWFSIWVYHLSTWSWEKSLRARSKLVPQLCEEGCGLFMKALHWGLNIQAQHSNMLLLLIYFIDIVWIEVNIQIALCCHAVTRLKNNRSQVQIPFTPLFLDNYLELRRQMFNPVLVSSALAKWLSFCGRRWRMRVRGGEKIARTKWGVRIMNNKYIASKEFLDL